MKIKVKIRIGLRYSLDFLKLKEKKKKKGKVEIRGKKFFKKKPWHRAIIILQESDSIIEFSNRCHTILCTFILFSMNGNDGIDFARKEEDRKEALTFVSTTPMIY